MIHIPFTLFCLIVVFFYEILARKGGIFMIHIPFTLFCLIVGFFFCAGALFFAYVTRPDKENVL
jgi:hypothetical protein